MRYLFILALTICSFWVAAPAKSQGITATDCETDSEGAVTALGVNAKCYMPAEKWEATFYSTALCKGFPDFENNLDNCVSSDISTTLVSVTRGSEVSLDGLIPPSGTYDYSLAILSNSFKIGGQVKFSAALNAIGNTGSNNEGINGEMYCTAPTIDQRTSDIFSNERPGSFIAMHNAENSKTYGQGYLSMTRCSATEIADTSDTGSYIIDALTTDSSFGSRKSDNSYDLDPTSPLNIVILQDDNTEATSTSNASRVMLIEKKETVVPVGATKATFTYNLDQALNVWNCPLASCAPNNLTTINMGLLNLEVVYE
jgi:hypothetical protein